ncbi:hypothetical protein E2C01_085316 [Portunus trituberculatus]|uniref:Uncharacterized protein n=1 Tax=Portunus trituberculatus TaxID=210409 RepID=A0A5B7JA52_PORTR|nr:hypothetical protein [Portunus trituberculatus]
MDERDPNNRDVTVMKGKGKQCIEKVRPLIAQSQRAAKRMAFSVMVLHEGKNCVLFLCYG